MELDVLLGGACRALTKGFRRQSGDRQASEVVSSEEHLPVEVALFLFPDRPYHYSMYAEEKLS